MEFVLSLKPLNKLISNRILFVNFSIFNSILCFYTSCRLLYQARVTNTTARSVRIKKGILRCPGTQTVTVKFANYSRTRFFKCGMGFNTKCVSETSLKIVSINLNVYLGLSRQPGTGLENSNYNISIFFFIFSFCWTPRSLTERGITLFYCLCSILPSIPLSMEKY